MTLFSSENYKILYPKYKLVQARKDITWWTIDDIHLGGESANIITKGTICQLLDETDSPDAAKRILKILDLRTLKVHSAYLDSKISLFDIEVFYFDIIK